MSNESNIAIEPLNRRYRVILTPAVDKALRHLAVERGVTISDVLTTAVEQHVMREGWLESAPTSADRPPESFADAKAVFGMDLGTSAHNKTTSVFEAADVHVATSDEVVAELGLDVARD